MKWPGCLPGAGGLPLFPQIHIQACSAYAAGTGYDVRYRGIAEGEALHGGSRRRAGDRGTLHGRDFLARLREYDQRLQPLVAALSRQHVPLRDSARYRALVQDIRGYVTNEVNRCLNRILDPAKGGDPTIARVIVERLDFRGLAKEGRLSRDLRRIIGSAGRAAVTRKLESLREDLGIEPAEENPAYSSQECDGCGYTARNNRRTRALFKCRFCGKTVHADTGGARTLLGRSQAGGLPRCRTRGQVLDHLDGRFRSRWGRPSPRRPSDSTSTNGRHESRPAPTPGQHQQFRGDGRATDFHLLLDSHLSHPEGLSRLPGERENRLTRMHA